MILVGCQEALENRYELSLPNETIFLGHKGSGTQGEFGNSYPDNSISGILHAIEALDGAEFDLQLSVDSTLWLFHDHVMLNCSGDLVNIASISDSSIEANSVCNYASKIARFEDLVKALDTLKDTTKTLSLDLKVLQNPESIKTFGGEAELALFVAERIKNLLSEKNSYQVFIEVPFSSQVHIMESITGRTTFLIHNSFEYLREPLRMNHSAPIHHFYEDLPQLFNNYGQKSLLWVVNSADEMMNAITLKPKAIQTDNIPMVHFFQGLSKKGGNIKELARLPQQTTSEEYILIMEQPINFDKDVLFEVEIPSLLGEEVLLVISSVNQQGEATSWQAITPNKSHHYFYFGAKHHNALETTTMKFFLWNQTLKKVDVERDVVLRRVIVEG